MDGNPQDRRVPPRAPVSTRGTPHAVFTTRPTPSREGPSKSGLWFFGNDDSNPRNMLSFGQEADRCAVD
jgi:hypothetical protein